MDSIYLLLLFLIGNLGLEFSIISYMYYDSITLELIKEENLILGLIQENLIENSIQDCLPYILLAHSLCSPTLAYF